MIVAAEHLRLLGQDAVFVGVHFPVIWSQCLHI